MYLVTHNLQKKRPLKGNPVTCEVCQAAMGYLDQVLSDNATETEIIQALDSLCSNLPSSVSGEVIFHNLYFLK